MLLRLHQGVEQALVALERSNAPRLGFASWMLLLIHTAALVNANVARPLQEVVEPLSLATMALSYVTVVAVGELIHVAFARRRVLLFLASCFYIACYGWLLGYAIVTRQSLEWDLIRDNLKEIFYKESLVLIFAWPAPLGILATVLISALGIWLEVRFRFVTRWPGPARRPIALVAWLGVWMAALFQPFSSADELSYFLQTVHRFYTFKMDSAQQGQEGDVRYPLVQHPVEGSARARHRPHVFVVAMESFNADFVDRTAPTGVEYTPVFNQLLRRGMYVKRFYGNSVQTARGHLSISCSLPDSFRRKVFTGHPDLNLHCLPAILKEQGWHTMFFMASRDLEFDQMGQFMARNGFMTIKAMDDTMVSPQQAEKYMETWGLRDDAFFGNVFDYLDQHHARDEASGVAATQPYFVTLATISHHNPFTPLPEGSPLVFPEPREFTERFANSLHVSDAYLGRFVRELEARPWLADSLVIITADHGFPGGEHGNRFNHVGYQEDHFHTPLLVWWPGKVQPGVMEDQPFSQLDIAPTVLDLLGIRTDHHFLGRSIFTRERTDAPIPLVQPYDGKYLAVVRGHFKYVKHLRTRREYLHNVVDDPREAVNLVNSPAHQEVLARLRDDLRLLYLNQQLIEEDRVWPVIPERGMGLVKAN